MKSILSLGNLLKVELDFFKHIDYNRKYHTRQNRFRIKLCDLCEKFRRLELFELCGQKLNPTVKFYDMTQKYINDISYKIIGAAIEVHRNLGPGLWEKVYEKCLTKELIDMGFKVDFQKAIPINYKGIDLECELRYDIMVNDAIIVEIKSVDAIHPRFEAQLLT